MSLPPANSDPRVYQIRLTTQNLYSLLFNSFQTISNLASTYNQIATASTNKVLKDDIAWLKESIDKDIEKLNALQKHLQFLNAQETITTPGELLKVFNEITDFAQLILLDDLITTLEGIGSVITEDELMIDGVGLKDVVILLKKFSISLKLAVDPLKKLKDEEVSVIQLEKSEVIITERVEDLKKRVTELENIIN
ncbi:hypothetical protein WICANDRAFT_62340 [Wickerhamomyces anomalus NRRL Y-366-8]|uniref:Uncharacterized protein n=1 Tax=Wickerhamomyces anomalus (strain ATCC 58044 / CBS 1984 / NCYC 433 / NRRL Y-366-8) TaxID=683960 RepID=A0A1E3P3H3_WICAA|nr:uncharacterized protein WICANDRAFT_62340 [Wickerhamomyces anomalus NRRL Y-366-8]ODQ59754.1 hypothetical protein WICANDRAFT_62340 [Wickerhamomyces anomalus NRRL Y-366-8]